MKSAVIVDCVRTPVGRAHKDKGVFREVRSDDLAVAVVKALVQRTGIDPNLVEDVVMGNTQQTMEQGLNVARNIVLLSGLPAEVGGTTVMASDGCDAKSQFVGFKLALSVPTEADADRVFNALADGGKIEMPLVKTFWSPRFGMVTDKFGVDWMVMVPGPNHG